VPGKTVAVEFNCEPSPVQPRWRMLDCSGEVCTGHDSVRRESCTVNSAPHPGLHPVAMRHGSGPGTACGHRYAGKKSLSS